MSVVVKREIASEIVAKSILASRVERKSEEETLKFADHPKWLALPEVSSPHEWQIEILESLARHPFAIAGIQAGKTGGGGRWLFDRMWEDEDPGVYFIVGPDYPMLRKSTMYKFERMIPGGLNPGSPDSWLVFHNKTDKHMRFKWGDDLFYGSADNPDDLRGPTVKDFWIDEISLCDPGTLKIMQGRLIATGGRGICTGTPKGIELLTEIQLKAETNPERYSYTSWSSFDNPGADRQILEELAEDWSEDYKEQELFGKLVDWGDAVFKMKYIAAAQNGNLRLLDGPVGGDYLNLWDLARKKDWVVGFTLDLSVVPARVVAYERFQHEPWPIVVAHIEARHNLFGGTTRIDSTGVGDPVMGFLNIPVEGVIFTPKSKTDMLQSLVVALEHGAIEWPSPRNEPDLAQLNKELRFYRWNDKGLEKDCIMSLAMGATDLVVGSEADWADASVVVSSSLGSKGGDW